MASQGTRQALAHGQCVFLASPGAPEPPCDEIPPCQPAPQHARVTLCRCFHERHPGKGRGPGLSRRSESRPGPAGGENGLASSATRGGSRAWAWAWAGTMQEGKARGRGWVVHHLKEGTDDQGSAMLASATKTAQFDGVRGRPRPGRVSEAGRCAARRGVRGGWEGHWEGRVDWWWQLTLGRTWPVAVVSSSLLSACPRSSHSSCFVYTRG